ncbi:MAG TPA: type II secretion system major pseudopilin GspG [Candidatus Tectomicrobia bacterium]|jgi:general secretion pathway protein G|nr:type II secretion system major pseudopilin GspG [Candidatus Tectomicrobia bacterium]
METSAFSMSRLLVQRAGFTLIEIMVVIIILGLLATLVIPNITGYTEKAKREKARADIASLEGALELFKADNGFYPTTEQGLDALIIKPSTGRIPAKWMEGGYFKKGVPLDPWGNRYVYFAPGRRGEGYEIVSLGTDGQESDDDVSSSEHLDSGRALAR